MSDAKEQAMTDDMQRALELANEIIDRWGTSAPWARDGRTLATALLASRAEVERMRAVVEAAEAWQAGVALPDEDAWTMHCRLVAGLTEAIDRAKAGG